MPAGFQAFNSGGGLAIEISDRVYRVLTILTIPTTTTGSVAVTGLTSGEATFAPVVYDQSKRQPTLGVSGGNLTWNYGSIASGDRDTNYQVRVGVF